LSLVFTIYYFVHFLIILPWLGWVEKPKEMPASIADAVLKKEKAAVPAAAVQPAE
jgi:ubiquinol-cytochrome c reductase cytochrome b subunit